MARPMNGLPYQKTIIVVCFVLAAWCLSSIDCGAQTTTLIITNIADAASTEFALRANTTAREANPILGESMAQRLAVKTAGTIVSVYLVKKLEKKNRTIAKIAGYTVAGFFGCVAVNNVRVGLR